MSNEDTIGQQALEWALATQEADFAGWDGLVRWLEEDPRHADAYDRALAAGNAMAELTALAGPVLPRAANDDAPSAVIQRERRARRGWLYGALAASVLAIVAVPFWQMRPQPYSVVTAMGETDSVELADGSRILLNGGTRLTLDRGNIRFARLERGEALFEVRHNASDPFVVVTGDVRLVDAGTAFNVIQTGSALDVAVSEGVVIVNPEAENVRLPAGRRAQVDGATDGITVSDIARDQIGSWRSGQLSFADAPLADVAAALERSIGTRVAVSSAMAARPFSGVIQIRGRDAQAIARIAPVLGARAVRRADGWELIGTDETP
ncbi:FecR domain-containing protein [Blastomonas sp. AAP53]|uniref:FecR family protein n=1 Tax=Blastomonas sp. AAP53 TaxID=1248760 RepID=UPI0002F53477|nr:FecR domain-containing protein [Blastomonas sp. AAP53]